MVEDQSPPHSAAGKKKPAEKKKRVLEEGDCLKAILVSGRDDEGRPKEGDLVVFQYTTYTEEGSVVESTQIKDGGKGVPFKLVLGRSKMIAGWEEGLPTMSRGEVSRFKLKEKLHFGDPECPVPVPEHFPTTGTLEFEIHMEDFFKVEVVTEDLGVLKQVLNVGDGWETPREPYEVRIRVTGRTRGGAKFIVREEDPLHFTFGKREVPDGLEKGVGTMNKNEKAIIHILNPSYITEASAVPELPTQAEELQFEVQLVQIIQVRDMLGNGAVIKRRVKDGKGEFPVDCPLQDSILRIHWRGKLPREGGRVFYDTRAEGRPFEFRSGEGMLPEGLEMSVRLMLPEEISVVTSTSKYAYDNFTRPASVPEGALVQWEVELLSFEKMKDWTGMNFREIIDDAEKQKSTGNRLFKEGKFELAKNKYEFLLREFKHVNPDGEEEVKELSNAQISLQLNVAACWQKLKDHVKAIEMCNKVLEGNPHHVKALFRRGTSYTASSDFEDARKDFNQMMKIDKSSEPDALSALSRLRKAEQEAVEKARKQFKGLFDKKPGALSEQDEMEKEAPTDVDEDKDENEEDIKIESSLGSQSSESVETQKEHNPFNFRTAGINFIRKLTGGRCSIL
ncbi:FK506-binding protein 4/5 [Marchantia polymorpha subsp. ruderalis]|uniref:peptidylprolyl isomerase n=1 Tax=Marchantia polymorpha TaxID=3197 RepID=A0A2R6WKY0_MARPO|nr:hypothetical protein MARPO_0079s0030 [Marchantia polymorpha]BBN20032.1 hypothetical protein Mp_8g15820 [Marchantia polymorpha subsp. ruderalis]|eukprot:PTQ34520.1 hypothetical protein MARPO_0079s0030 [Marchantia polymorpha]